jgi:hypothetical protein
MEKMRQVHLDELPERCRQDIRRFFRIPHSEPNRGRDRTDFYRDPTEYIILASKERNGSNYSKWQASFLKKADIPTFKEHNPKYWQRFYEVWEENIDA